MVILKYIRDSYIFSLGCLFDNVLWMVKNWEHFGTEKKTSQVSAYGILTLAENMKKEKYKRYWRQ
jgi:hypothetical protein